MSVKKKIILTILLAVLVGVLVTWFVGEIYNMVLSVRNISMFTQYYPTEYFTIQYNKAQFGGSLAKCIVIICGLSYIVYLIIKMYKKK